MLNYSDVLAQLQAHGLLVQHLQVDGRVHRCRVADEGRETRGWYLLHEWRAPKGDALVVGSFGVWRGTDPGTQKIQISKDRELTKEDQAALRARLAEDRKRAKAHEEERAKRAAARAAKVWAKALQDPPDQGSEYLERKRVRAYGLRYSDSGALVIPIQDARGQIWGLQFVLPKGHPHRKKTGRNKTYWPQGTRVSGHFHLIGDPAAQGVCLIAEGYATAATIHETTGLPVAVAFSANNLLPVSTAVKKAFRTEAILVCADDDYLTDGNPGCTAAAAAALAVGGEWTAPSFPVDRGGAKLTDFNDLACMPEAGPHLVRAQINAALMATGWAPRRSARGIDTEGGGDSGLPSLLTIDEACDRYSLIYGGKGTLFDHREHMLVPKADVQDILPDSGWRDWKARKDRRVVRLDQVGFDPTETDSRIKCNLWAGWPTEPKQGECQYLLDLLGYLCSGEPNSDAVVDWVLKWLAYPLQNPGAKMKTALVFHGPQGVGKNLFFEAVMEIYGEYGRVVDQAAIEDKFNDWMSRKLFLVADEVVARMELFHLKNKLKALVTGDSIRINPKNVTPHDEKNHVNLVFLSNERQPLVLEKDDRRYCVVWVPGKLPPDVYSEIGKERRNGGVAALYHHLLNLDLDGFTPWEAPPPTRAKGELIEVSMESTERFLRDWQNDELDWPFMACGSMDLYAAYRKWANSNGVARPRESNHFLGMINKLDGWVVRPCHIKVSKDKTKSQKMVIPPDHLLKDDAARRMDETAGGFYTRSYYRFAETVHQQVEF